MAVTVLSAVALQERHRRLLAGAGGVELLQAQPGSPDWEAAAARAEVLFTGVLPPGALAACTRLRWVQCMYAGVDRLLPELAGRTVALTSARGLHAHTMADHAYLLMLALARQLPRFVRQQDRAVWEFAPARELRGGCLVVVGLGATGQEIARRAPAFGLRVLGVRRHPSPVEGVEEVFGPDRLREALARADWVVLACPLTPETRGLIGRAELAAMKPGAALINLARGEVVDEEALVEALASGRLAGAGLDVFAREPLPADSPLWRLPQVIVTPHVAGSLPDYVDRAVELFADNLRRYLAGEPLRNRVDPARGY